jgi:hypothetical protein
MMVASATYDTETDTHTPGMIILNSDIPGALAIPPHPEDFEERLGRMLIGLHANHPQAVYEDRLREARCCLYRFGKRDNSVVLAATAVETLVDNTLTALAWDSGMDPGMAAKSYYVGQGLRQRIRIHLAEILGGDWDPRGGGPVAVWDAQLARLRHRVVHDGYLPTRHEAEAALAALSGFEQHLIARVAAVSVQYRKTAVVIAARPGLEAHGMYSREFQDWVERDAPGDMMESYLAWRSELFTILE